MRTSEFGSKIRLMGTVLAAGCLLAGGVSGCNSDSRRQAEAPRPITIERPAADEETEEERVAEAEDTEAKKPAKDTRPFGRDRSILAAFYVQKYTDDEIDAVRDNLGEILPDYSEKELDAVALEILDYHHVIYHPSKRHNLAANHKVVEEIKPLVEDACHTFDVPLEPVMAIISWENSGDTDKVSWANAVGVGQMTTGAAERAHVFGKEEAVRLRRQAARLSRSENADDVALADELKERADLCDCAARHKKVAKEAGETNERLVPELAVEDMVLYFKYLLHCYDGRVDLAISAYHNGVGNNDDLIAEYARVKEGKRVKRGKGGDGIVEAIERLDIKYLDLWNCTRVREMLAGLRTVEGPLVGEGNKHLALGDESDIYPWKVLGSWTGYKAGPHYVETEIDYNKDRWEVAEIKGLLEYTKLSELEKLAAAGNWVILPFAVNNVAMAGPAKEVAQGKGAAGASAAAGKRGGKAALVISPAAAKLSKYATPELIGYLADLDARWKSAVGNKKVKLPLGCLSGAWAMGTGKQACLDKCTATHWRGAAADIYLERLPQAERAALNVLLRRDFLFSRIYMTRGKHGVHIVLNPRFGNEFLQAYRRYVPAPVKAQGQTAATPGVGTASPVAGASAGSPVVGAASPVAGASAGSPGVASPGAGVAGAGAGSPVAGAGVAGAGAGSPVAGAGVAGAGAGSPDANVASPSAGDDEGRSLVHYGEVGPRQLCDYVRAAVSGKMGLVGEDEEAGIEDDASPSAHTGSQKAKKRAAKKERVAGKAMPVNTDIIGIRRAAKKAQVAEDDAKTRHQQEVDKKKKATPEQRDGELEEVEDELTEGEEGALPDSESSDSPHKRDDIVSF